MRALLPLLLALAIAHPVQAAHCTTWSTTDAWIPAPPGHYVIVDIPNTKCCYSIWIYEESNGLEGLQRGDEVVDDTCHGMIDSDTIIF